MKVGVSAKALVDVRIVRALGACAELGLEQIGVAIGQTVVTVNAIADARPYADEVGGAHAVVG
jgi:hypothetical protein